MHASLFAVTRIRGYVTATLAGLLCAALILAMPIDMHPVIGRTGVFNLLWPIILSLGGLISIPILRHRDLTLVKSSPYRMQRTFLDLGCICFVIVLSSGVASLGLIGFMEILPGLLFYVLLASACYPWAGGTAWMPGVGYALLVWLLGTDHFGIARPWAVTLPSAPDVAPWIACALVSICALLGQATHRR